MSDYTINENLKALFNPSTVAVIGASAKPDKLGFHVMKSLIKGNFKGRIVPVNPGSKEIMGITAYASIDLFQGLSLLLPGSRKSMTLPALNCNPG